MLPRLERNAYTQARTPHEEDSPWSGDGPAHRRHGRCQCGGGQVRQDPELLGQHRLCGCERYRIQCAHGTGREARRRGGSRRSCAPPEQGPCPAVFQGCGQGQCLRLELHPVGGFRIWLWTGGRKDDRPPRCPCRLRHLLQRRAHGHVQALFERPSALWQWLAELVCG